MHGSASIFDGAAASIGAPCSVDTARGQSVVELRTAEQLQTEALAFAPCPQDKTAVRV
jgi:hypothetical protein